MGFLDHPLARAMGEGECEDFPRPRDWAPRRVYARIDRVEPLGDGTRIVYDCVDADWLEREAEGIRWLGDPERSAEIGENVSVIEEDRDEELNAEELEGLWRHLILDQGGRDALHFLNLFAAPLERTLIDDGEVGPGTRAVLAEKTGFGKLREATTAAISALLERHSRMASSAAVYDVGQGASCAVLRGDVPTLYFDVGGAAQRDTRTFPATLSRFCVTADPPVVMSHWDWDHWSSACRDPRLMERDWIVPRHDGEIGAVHTRFLGDLRRRGRVHLWPLAAPSVEGGSLTLLQCGGNPKDHNNSGLAMIFRANPEDGGGRMLLPGDAAYRHVPGAGEGSFTSVVVPHHGGRTPGGEVPASDGAAAGRLVYSYGAGNSYWHPYADVGREHAKVWKKNLHTAARGPDGLGHVQLFWNAGEQPRRLPCRGRSCQLACQQC